jgi:hypothetical protein
MNPYFLVLKMNRKYGLILSAVNVNGNTRDNASIESKVEVFSEAFAELRIWSLIIFPSWYNQKMLHKNTLNYM